MNEEGLSWYALLQKEQERKRELGKKEDEKNS